MQPSPAQISTGTGHHSCPVWASFPPLSDEECGVVGVVGFTSRSYFNRFVRRDTGMSPNSFRETLLGEARSENRSEAQTTGEVHAFDTEK